MPSPRSVSQVQGGGGGDHHLGCRRLCARSVQAKLEAAGLRVTSTSATRRSTRGSASTRSPGSRSSSSAASGKRRRPRSTSAASAPGTGRRCRSNEGDRDCRRVHAAGSPAAARRMPRRPPRPLRGWPAHRSQSTRMSLALSLAASSRMPMITALCLPVPSSS